MLPLIATSRLSLGAGGYGVLLGALGCGAVVAAALLQRLRSALGSDRLTAGANAVCGAAGVILALVRSEIEAIVVMLAFGAGWIAVLAVLNVGIQNSVAGWVRARMLAAYVVVYFGSFSLGSLVWGAVADHVGPTMTLMAAGSSALLATIALVMLPAEVGEPPDLQPMPSSDAPLLLSPGDDHGAVLVTNEWRVRPENASEFDEAMAALRASRHRTGAVSWRRWRDPDDEVFRRESYIVESRVEHLRQETRRTMADEAAWHNILALADGAPTTRLLRSADGPSRSAVAGVGIVPDADKG